MSLGCSLASNKVGCWETGCEELAGKGDGQYGYTDMAETGYDDQINNYTEHKKSHCWRRYLQIQKGKAKKTSVVQHRNWEYWYELMIVTDGWIYKVIDMCLYLIHTRISQLCLRRGSKNNDTSVATNRVSVQILVFKMLFPTRKIQGYLEKWLIPKLEQEKYKTKLEHPVLTDSKETLK